MMSLHYEAIPLLALLLLLLLLGSLLLGCDHISGSRAQPGQEVHEVDGEASIWTHLKAQIELLEAARSAKDDATPAIFHHYCVSDQRSCAGCGQQPSQARHLPGTRPVRCMTSPAGTSSWSQSRSSLKSLGVAAEVQAYDLLLTPCAVEVCMPSEMAGMLLDRACSSAAWG